MARIVVVGTSCSGKSTFARRLAERAGIAHIELDALYWMPQWTPRPNDDFRDLVEKAIARDHWVIDGNYSRVRPMIFARATTIVWLNYAFPLVLWRGLKRTVRRSLTKEELWSGNRESLRKAFFSRESILWWVITTHRRRRRTYQGIFADPMLAHIERVNCRTPQEAEGTLQRLAGGRT